MSVSYHRATREEIRATGFVVGGALAVLGVLQLLLHGKLSRPPAIQILFAVSGCTLLFGAVAPSLLRPLHWAWMKLAEAVGWVVNWVLLSVTFFVLFTLTGLIVRLAGRDALRRRFRDRRESYWQRRDGDVPRPERYERQF